MIYRKRQILEKDTIRPYDRSSGKEAVPELVLEESVGVEQKERREVGWRKWQGCRTLGVLCCRVDSMLEEKSPPLRAGPCCSDVGALAGLWGPS